MSCIPINDFSLITLCDATKVGKLYSIVPDTGAGDFDVARATTATYLGSDGLIKTAANNEPRIEFNADGSYKGLLVEPAATNLVLRSQEFDDAVWSKLRTTITQNNIIAPNGTMTADKMTADIDDSTYGIDFSTLTGTGTFTASIFAKKGSVDWLYIRQGNSGGGTRLVRAWFDLNNGVVGGATPSPISHKIEDYGNGWYRCSMTFEVLAGGIPRPQFYLSTDDEIASFTSDGTDNLFLWGAQLEEGTVATSYIPTVASTVTRAADSISKTNASALIGQTEGTLYAEVDISNFRPPNRLVAISDGTTDNRIIVVFGTNNRFRFIASINGTNVFDENTTLSYSPGDFKIAITYAQNSYDIFINGAKVISISSGNVPACNSIFLGKVESSSTANLLNDHIKAVAILPTALSEQEAINLTS